MLVKYLGSIMAHKKLLYSVYIFSDRVACAEEFPYENISIYLFTWLMMYIITALFSRSPLK